MSFWKVRSFNESGIFKEEFFVEADSETNMRNVIRNHSNCYACNFVCELLPHVSFENSPQKIKFYLKIS